VPWCSACGYCPVALRTVLLPPPGGGACVVLLARKLAGVGTEPSSRSPAPRPSILEARVMVFSRFSQQPKWGPLLCHSQWCTRRLLSSRGGHLVAGRRRNVLHHFRHVGLHLTMVILLFLCLHAHQVFPTVPKIFQ
jgi:hypothetical protein